MNFRHFNTSAGKLVLCGKSAEQNEEVVKFALADEYVLHTAKPGSPFCVIKGKAAAEDIKETAVFCASKSQAWRDSKSDVLVHYFKGKDIFKESGMKIGTFGVKKFKAIKVKKGDIKRLISSKEKENV